MSKGCGMGYAATMYLLEQGIRVTGTDVGAGTRPLTRPLSAMPRPAMRADLGGSQGGRHIGYCHLEKLHNLESLPAKGFTVSCFPTRYVARRPAGPGGSYHDEYTQVGCSSGLRVPYAEAPPRAALWSTMGHG